MTCSYTRLLNKNSKSPRVHFSVKSQLNTTNLCRSILERWRMMMFLMHCGVGCPEERRSWPCRISRRGRSNFDLQPVDVLPICSNRKAEIFSKRWEAGCVGLHGHGGHASVCAPTHCLQPPHGLQLARRCLCCLMQLRIEKSRNGFEIRVWSLSLRLTNSCYWLRRSRSLFSR